MICPAARIRMFYDKAEQGAMKNKAPCFFRSNGRVKLRDFYERAIEAGVQADPRGRNAVAAELQETEKPTKN